MAGPGLGALGEQWPVGEYLYPYNVNHSTLGKL